MNCLRLNEKEPLKAGEALKTRLIEKGLAPLPAHKELLAASRIMIIPGSSPGAKGAVGKGIKSEKRQQGEVSNPVLCRVHTRL